MYTRKEKGLAWMLLCTTFLLPAIVLAEGEQDGLDCLEAKIARALVSRLVVPDEDNDEAYAVGDRMPLGQQHTLTVTSYETGDRFHYSPSGGLTMLTLRAKSGYSLLFLYVTVENDSHDELSTAKLLDTVLECSDGYTNKAQDSLFYQNNRGVFVGGLKSVGPKASVDGCMLFAVPEDAQDSREGIAVRFTYDDIEFACTLQQAGSLLERSGDQQAF